MQEVPAPAPLLSARALQIRRGSRVLHRSVSLDVSRGRLVWLRGPNGCGKTTLLRTLAGLHLADAGSFSTAPLAYIGHLNGLKDELTVTENLRFQATLSGLSADKHDLDHALSRWGLRRHAQIAAKALSQGLRRRTALARLSLPRAPALWLLDEPFDGLDAQGTELLRNVLTNHALDGGAALLTSHQDPGLGDPLLDRLDFDAPASR